jgi:hypothetical protein
MGNFIIKRINTMKPQKKVSFNTNEVKVENKKEEIKEQVMTTSEKIEMAQNVLNETPSKFKRVKKDKGLIERTESSKTILTEDNKELLND